jgi:hypothetical protein
MICFSTELTDVICWTRIQAEAGQDIRSIIARKNLERRAGNGLFAWGVGNAPSRSIRRLAAKGEDIDIVFSLMKSRPKARDCAPDGVVAWRTYLDIHDVEKPLPPNVLVTSRMETGSGAKSVHYALMCRSDEELQLGDLGPFDPSAYRNIGDVGGPVSNSQVTALVVRRGVESPVSDYRINFRAKFTSSYWVKLARPCILGESARMALTTATARAGEMDGSDWIGMVTSIRCVAPPNIEEQSYLF